VLEECERGQDAAKKRYRDALGKELPPNVRAVVDRQVSARLAARPVCDGPVLASSGRRRAARARRALLVSR
jgi:hypothetical protein